MNRSDLVPMAYRSAGKTISCRIISFPTAGTLSMICGVTGPDKVPDSIGGRFVLPDSISQNQRRFELGVTS
jgi:hypothetical protein